MNNLLLRTPLPKNGESYRGYILRLSEANGLSTPARMLGLAGMHDLKIRLAEHPVEALTKLTGHDQNIFSEITYSNNIDGMPQLSGHKLPKAYLRLRQSHVCPECVSTLGYIPAKWDLLAATVCPIHKRKLIDKCQECSEPLNWFRPGMLTCRCNAIIVGGKDEPPSLGLIELTQTIWAVMDGKKLSDQDSTLGMPLEYLTNMSLRTLLGVSHVLGAIKLHLDGSTSTAKAGTDAREIEAAADLYVNWPHDYHYFLSRYGEQHGKNAIGLYRQFLGLMSKLFGMGYPENEVQFLRKTFVEFGKTHWNKAFVDSRLIKSAGVSNDKKYLGVYEYAKRIGVMSSTVKTMIRRGQLSVKTVTKGNFTKKLILLEDSNDFIPYKGKTLKCREAAKHLGIPVSVLSSLRKSGHFKIQYLADPQSAYCLADLDNFNAEILQVQDHANLLPSDTITIAKMMRMKLKKNDIKAKVIAKLIEGEILAFGPAAKINELRISKRIVLELSGQFLGSNDGLCLTRDAAAILGVASDGVYSLYRAGLITGQETPNALFLDKASVEAFSNRYVSLAQIARESKTNSRKCSRICDVQGIHKMMVPRKFGPPRPFILREDANRM